MLTDRYHLRRVVSYVAFHIRKGCSLAEAIDAAKKRRPPFPEEWIREAWPLACQSVRNARAINGACPLVRLCDIKGCKYPNG
jgi:hypothetical protein